MNNYISYSFMQSKEMILAKKKGYTFFQRSMTEMVKVGMRREGERKFCGRARESFFSMSH